jgi:MFS family permease
VNSRPSSDWRLLLALYWITSFIEGLGVSQIYAFMPNRLAEVGVAQADIPHFVGALGALFFLTGLPLIPLWGVWADKYSRKAVIIRSALVEAVVFGVIAASAAPWQLVVGMLLVGFQLGNSGVMMAAIRDSAPRHRLGLAMGIFAASSPLGFGAGPALGGVMIDGLHLSSGAVFAVASILSIAMAVLLAVGSTEVRPEVVPTGRTIRLAFGAVKGVMSDPIVRWLFVVYGLVFVGRQMSSQYIALMVHAVDHTSYEVAGSVGLVLGLATVVGAGLSPFGGALADRLGFRPVLVAAIAGLAVAFALLPVGGSVAWLAATYSLAIASQAVVGAMVSGLIATEAPAERRSATLNLIYLPLYIGGIVGPAIGAGVVTAGLDAVFFLAAAIVACATLLAVVFARRTFGPGSGETATAAGGRGAAESTAFTFEPVAFETAGLETAGLETVAFETAGLEAGGPAAAGLDPNPSVADTTPPSTRPS